MALMGLKERCLIHEIRHKGFNDGFKDSYTHPS